jgi:integrase
MTEEVQDSTGEVSVNINNLKKGTDRKKARRTGQIIPRGENKFLVRIFLGRDGVTGKRRYHNATVRGTKKDAQRYMNGILREIDLGSFAEPSKLSLKEFIDRWLNDSAKPAVRERTYKNYEYLLNHYVIPKLGAIRLSSLKPLEIQKLYTELYQEKKLSAKSVRHVHVTLSGALNQAFKWRLIPMNPATLVELPKIQRKEMLALSQEEVSRFIQAAQTDRYGTMFIFAVITGMRPGEYMGLQWKDMDLERGTVTVQRTLVTDATESGNRFGETKTAQSRRTIPISEILIRLLKDHKKRQAEERLKAGSEWKAFDLVFCTEMGSPVDLPNVRTRNFKPILERAKISPKFRIYDLRHTCATLLLSKGIHPKVASERLGHSSVVLTLNTYSHVLPTMQAEASETLEKMCFAETGTR